MSTTDFSPQALLFCRLSFALAVSALAAPVADAQEIPERCTKCHAEKKILDDVAKMPAAERDKRLDAFLVKHFATDAKERKTIVEALKKKVAER